MSDNNTFTWKHIGFHGLAVGTFVVSPDHLQWKSSVGHGDGPAPSRKAKAPTNAYWTVFGKTGSLRIVIGGSAPNNNVEWRLDGFPVSDFDTLKKAFGQYYSVEVMARPFCSHGVQYGLSKIKKKNLELIHCELAENLEEGQEFEVQENDTIFNIELNQVSQCVQPGTNRNEIELQFPETDTMEAGTDQLVSIRMYIPPDLDADPSDKTASTAAEELQQKILEIANIRKTTGDVVVSFDQCAFLTPRGRYTLELYDKFLRMRGQKYDYKIRYDDINRLFLLPKPDEVHMAFVIALDKPIRQGQQRYPYLVMQATKDTSEITVNLDEETLEKEYKNQLQPVMRGSISNLIAKSFKILTSKKVFIPGKYANASQQACVHCSVRANEGFLYPLEKQFVFIHKPPIIVRFSEIESVEFQRYAGGSRNFDLAVNLKDTSIKEYNFSGIDRSDYASLYNFLSSKNIRIRNIEEPQEETRKKPVYNEDEIFGGAADDDDEESDDESYGGADAAKDEAPASSDDSDDMDDDEMGSEIDGDLDSDLEEARAGPTSKTPKTKKKAKKKASADSDDDSTAPAKKTKKKQPQKRKKKKDPNAPKRPMSSYFFFMNTSRDRIKEENPDAAHTDIGRIAGAEWKQLDADEKSKYESMAAKDKVRYKKEMESYTPPSDDDGDDDDRPKKKKAKKKKDPNAPKRALTAYFCFTEEMRPKLKAEQPDLSFGELGKTLGQMFRGLSSEEKSKYEALAKADKERYKEQVAQYEKKQQAADDDVSDSASSVDKKDSDSDDDDDDSDSD